MFLTFSSCSKHTKQNSSDNENSNIATSDTIIPIDMNNWQKTPFIKGRIATERDVKEGRAIFYINAKEKNHIPLNVTIPSLAYHNDQKNGVKTKVIVIQAEQTSEQKVAGIRYLDGSEGACLMEELEFVDHF